MQALDSLNVLIHEERITREEVQEILNEPIRNEPIELTDDEWLYLARHISDGIEEVGTRRATGFDYLNRAIFWYRR
jgi:hypothetical protein